MNSSVTSVKLYISYTRLIFSEQTASGAKGICFPGCQTMGFQSNGALFGLLAFQKNGLSEQWHSAIHTGTNQTSFSGDTGSICNLLQHKTFVWDIYTMVMLLLVYWAQSQSPRSMLSCQDGDEWWFGLVACSNVCITTSGLKSLFSLKDHWPQLQHGSHVCLND